MLHTITPETHQIVTGCFMIVSIVANFSLIALALTVNTVCIGSYRFLLIAFALADVVLSISHATCLIIFLLVIYFHAARAIQRVPHNNKHSRNAGYPHATRNLLCFAANFLFFDHWKGFAAVSFFVYSFYESYILLSFHFVYRYVVLCDPRSLAFLKSPSVAVASMITANLLYDFVISFVLWSVRPTEITAADFSPYIRSEYGVALNEQPFPGFIALRYQDKDGNFNMNAMAAMTACVSVVFATGIVMIFCVNRMVGAMRKYSTTVMSSTRQLQRQLFRALIVQATVPIFLNYIPIGTILVAPAFGTEFGTIGKLLMMTTTTFPALDPILVVINITSYRRAFGNSLRSLVGITPHSLSAHAVSINAVSPFTQMPLREQ